jgi:hypothetical protein
MSAAKAPRSLQQIETEIATETDPQKLLDLNHEIHSGYEASPKKQSAASTRISDGWWT